MYEVRIIWFITNMLVCLETQFEPNSVNSDHPPLIDGEKEYKTIYRFSGF